MDVPPSQTTASVPDLVQGQAYEFRVRAVNKAGPGEPSNETPPTVAKPRRCKFIKLLPNTLVKMKLYFFSFIRNKVYEI